ncbi:hypothetical protein MSIMFI_03264 [Mycobacterium simulans]|nr:hypothetical protein MSIMFI_03264 [Mycobacterium simulans]
MRDLRFNGHRIRAGRMIAFSAYVPTGFPSYGRSQPNFVRSDGTQQRRTTTNPHPMNSFRSAAVRTGASGR